MFPDDYSFNHLGYSLDTEQAGNHGIGLDWSLVTLTYFLRSNETNLWILHFQIFLEPYICNDKKNESDIYIDK